MNISEKKRNHLKAVFLSLSLQCPDALALPSEGTVTSGSATITSSTPNEMQINQSSDKAIINWQSFDVGQNQAVQFVVPMNTSATLNRVTGGNASQILGSVKSNGQLWLINPNGILFGAGSQVSAASLVASTLNIQDKDFLSGNYTLQQQGDTAAKIINEGHIFAQPNGFVTLLAPEVENAGVIAAKLGTVALGTGKAATLQIEGNRLLNFAVSDGADVSMYDENGNPIAALSNSGMIHADGGNVLLTSQSVNSLLDQSINMTGIIRANTVTDVPGVGSQAGKIVLSAVAEDILDNATIEAQGGNVEVLGEDVGLFGSTSINAAGGDIHIGRDADDPNAFEANETIIDPNVSLTGNFVETSGDVLQEESSNIHANTWLLDPYDLTITTNSDTSGGWSGNTFTAPSEDSNVNVATIETNLNSGNVTIITNGTGSANPGNITVSSDITSSSSHNLTLNAAGSITVDSDVTISVGKSLTLDAGGGGTGNIYIGGTVETGSVNGAALTLNAYDYAGLDSTGTITLGSGGRIITQGSGASSIQAGAGIDLQADSRVNNNGTGSLEFEADRVSSNTAGIVSDGSITSLNGVSLRVLDDSIQFTSSTNAIAFNSDSSTNVVNAVFTATTGSISIHGTNSLNKVTADTNTNATGGSITIDDSNVNGITLNNIDTSGNGNGGGGSNAGAINITAAGAVSIAEAITSGGGNVSITTTNGAISDAGGGYIDTYPITGTSGTTSLTANGTNGAVSLTNNNGGTSEGCGQGASGGECLGVVKASATGNIALEDTSQTGLNLENISSTNGDVSIAADGDINQTADTTISSGDTTSGDTGVSLSATGGIAQLGAISTAGANVYLLGQTADQESNTVAITQNNGTSNTGSINTNGGTTIIDTGDDASLGINLSGNNQFGTLEGNTNYLGNLTANDVSTSGLVLGAINSIGDISITANGTNEPITLGANIYGGSGDTVSLTTAGSGSITGGGTAIINGGQPIGTVELSSASGKINVYTDTPDLTFNTTGDVTITNTPRGLTLTGNNTGDNISLQAGGIQTTAPNSGASIAATGELTLDTTQFGGAITLGGNIQAATVNLNSTGNITTTGGNITATSSTTIDAGLSNNIGSNGTPLTGDFGNAPVTLIGDNVYLSDDDATGLKLAGGTISGNVTLNATGGMSQSGAVSVTGTTTLTAEDNIALTNASNSFTGAVRATGANVSVVNDGTLTLAGITANGNVTLAAEQLDNTGGPGAITTGVGDAWDIYLSNLSGNTFDNLASNNQAIWGTSYPTAISQTGNRYIFATMETLSLTPINPIPASMTLSKDFGNTITLPTPTGSGASANLQASGFVIASTYGGVFSQDSVNNVSFSNLNFTSAGTPVSVSAGSYAITLSGNTPTSTGYAVSYSPSATYGTLTVTGSAADLVSNPQQVQTGPANVSKQMQGGLPLLNSSGNFDNFDDELAENGGANPNLTLLQK